METVDAVPVPQLTELRNNFYKLIKEISPNLDIHLLAKYMQHSLNGNESVRIMENMTNTRYMKHLYKLQLIHPRNLDYILNFANSTRNENIQNQIACYYKAVVNGREDLLIDVNTKFMVPCNEQTEPPDDEIRRKSSHTLPPPKTQPIYRNEPNPVATTREVIHEKRKSQIEQVYEAFPSSEDICEPFIYPITLNRPHGHCVIINNEKFASGSGYILNVRSGTSKDRIQLVETFTLLNYTTKYYDNLSSRDMMDCLGYYANADHSSYDSFICCILTHGNAGNIFGSDSVQMKLNDIFDLFQVNSAPTLSDKPKIFIIQSCRGTTIDQGSKRLVSASDKYSDVIYQDALEPEPPLLADVHHLPLFCDFLIAYGTVEGYVAWRHPELGSWFIDILCNKLKEFSNNTDIMTILTYVNMDISAKKTGDGSKQMAEHVNSMKGLFYFN